MKYRTYIKQIKTGVIMVIALALGACASTGGRNPDSVNTEAESESVQKHFYDGREPASVRGDFTWLNQVEDDFSRIAAETSNRAVASEGKPVVLVKRKDWRFSYLPKTNNFYVGVQGDSYKMIQTKINDGERFSFAAEGQTENPLVFSVRGGNADGRGVASESCEAEISYWDKAKKAYVTDHIKLQGKPCAQLITRLKDYVP